MPTRPSPNQLRLPLPEENSTVSASSNQHPPERGKRKSPALERFTHPTKLSALVEEHDGPEASYYPIPAAAPNARHLAKAQAPAEPFNIEDPPLQSDQVEFKSKRTLLQRTWRGLVAFLLTASCILWSCWPYVIKTIEGIKIGVDAWSIVRDIGHSQQDTHNLPSEKSNTNSEKTGWHTIIIQK